MAGVTVKFEHFREHGGIRIERLFKAYLVAKSRLEHDGGMGACLISAGFISENGGPRKYEVQVKVTRVSKALLRQKEEKNGV